MGRGHARKKYNVLVAEAAIQLLLMMTKKRSSQNQSKEGILVVLRQALRLENNFFVGRDCTAS